jgi:acetyl-CoA C-acetyltransferase
VALGHQLPSFRVSLSGFSAPEIGSIAVRAAIERAGIEPTEIDEVIMGCVLQAGLGQNPARQAALKAGCPNSVAALTVNKVCGSGLKAVGLVAQQVMLDEIEYGVGGGMESMTNAPYLLPKAREGYRLGHGTLVDAMIQDGLWCAFENWHMGNTGEVVAEKVRNNARRAGRVRLQLASQSARGDRGRALRRRDRPRRDSPA